MGQWLLVCVVSRSANPPTDRRCGGGGGVWRGLSPLVCYVVVTRDVGCDVWCAVLSLCSRTRMMKSRRVVSVRRL